MKYRRWLPLFLLLSIILISTLIWTPLTLAQVTVGTSSTTSALTTLGWQTWIASGRYWVFWSDGTNAVYKTSTDGITWSSQSTLRTGISNGNKFSVWISSTTLVYIYGVGAGATNYYRHGTTQSDGSISWTAAEQTISIGSSCYNPSIVLTTDGHSWVGCGNAGTQSIFENTATDGTWSLGTYHSFPVSLCNYGGFEVPLTSGKIMAYGFTNSNCDQPHKYYSNWWTGSTWQGTDVVIGKYPSGSQNLYSPSKVSSINQGDDTLFVGVNNTNGNVVQYKFTYSTTSWSDMVIVTSALNPQTEPVIVQAYNDDDLYIFYGTTTQIRYYSNVNGGGWSASSTLLASDMAIQTILSVSYYAYTGNSIPMTYVSVNSGNLIRFVKGLGSPPSPPQNLAISSSGRQIVLTWQTPADNGGGTITNYKVYRGTSSGGETLYATLGVVLTYSDSGIIFGTEYYYKVTAVNEFGESDYSNEVHMALFVSDLSQNITLSENITQRWNATATLNQGIVINGTQIPTATWHIGLGVNITIQPDAFSVVTPYVAIVIPALFGLAIIALVVALAAIGLAATSGKRF